VKTLYLAKEPGTGVRNDLSRIQGEVTVVDCLNAYGDYYRKGGYNCISRTEFFALEDMKFDVVIGNPPYGSGGNLAIKFLNKCSELSDDVRLVLPLSVRKASSLNKISKNIVCVVDEQLPDDTFPKGIKAVYQRWVHTDTPREKIATHRTHKDFEFVKKEDNPDVMIFRCGASTGKLRFPGEFDDNKPDHYYIKATPEVVNNLKAISPRLIELSTVQNGMPGVSKHELILTYSNHFGE